MGVQMKEWKVLNQQVSEGPGVVSHNNPSVELDIWPIVEPTCAWVRPELHRGHQNNKMPSKKMPLGLER